MAASRRVGVKIVRARVDNGTKALQRTMCCQPCSKNSKPTAWWTEKVCNRRSILIVMAPRS